MLIVALDSKFLGSQIGRMIPAPDTTFRVRLNTNEMIERERLAAFLRAIEDEARSQDTLGSRAVLLIGAFDYGSLELLLSIASLVVSTVIAIPSLLVSLKQLSADKEKDPNSFAVSVGEMMALDGVSRIEMIHERKSVVIKSEEVPYAQSIRPKSLRPVDQDTFHIELADDQRKEQDNDESQIENEDVDWIPMLEASDHPPREVRTSPSGHVNALSLFGEFVKEQVGEGKEELRFIPRDLSFSAYFKVICNSYEAEPMEMEEYEVIGNIVINNDEPSTIEILAINPPSEDAMLTLKT